MKERSLFPLSGGLTNSCHALHEFSSHGSIIYTQAEVPLQSCF